MTTMPPLNYDVLAPQRMVFGWGRRAELASLAAELGRRAFVVLGSQTLEHNGAWQELAGLLDSAKIEHVRLATIRHEPQVQDVDGASEALRRHDPRPGDFVLAIGGGSAIDLGKAVAAMATHRASATVRDYLEGVGRGCQLVEPPLPVLAMPTTGGTGSEATKNAVISSDDPPFKKSLRWNLMIPRAVLVDPELSVSVPPQTTAYTGMDAITQLIESYLSRYARPIPRSLAVEGLRRALPAVVEATRDGSSRPAREAMAHAALLSGLALANSGLGLAHGVAAALGAHARVPHGLACAVMLPAALRVNRVACAQEMAALARETHISEDRNDAAAADALVAAIVALGAELKIPQRLSELGVSRQQLPALVAGSRGNSLNGNPRQLSDAELEAVLEALL